MTHPIAPLPQHPRTDRFQPLLGVGASPGTGASATPGTNPAALSSEHHAAYRLLVRRPGERTETLASQSGMPAASLARLLNDLARAGIAESVDGVWTALAPRDDLEELLASQERAFAELRYHHGALRSLQDIYAAAATTTRYEGIEVIDSREELLKRLDEFQRNATRTVRAFDRDPHYTMSDAAKVEAQLDRQGGRISSGLSYRVIYEPGMWDEPVHAASTLAAIAAGEEARVFERLPMKLYIFDDDRAVLPLDPRRHADGSTLVVHPSGLLQALAEIFEIIWGLSVPITAPGASAREDLGERERSVLTMLASGASDTRMVHQLDVSRSTVTRTIADLCSRAGVETRFQLAAEAVRRGWL